MNKLLKRISLFVLLCSISLLVGGQTPSAVCTSKLTRLTLELGQGIPLPQSFSTPTDRSVTFILTMQANSLFGPAHEVGRVTLPAKTGRTSSSAPIHPTGLRTPVGSARVVIKVTTDRTGGEVVGLCDYQLRLKAPPGVPGNLPGLQLTPQISILSWLYQVPVRMCVLEGSALAAGKTPGDTVDAREARQMLELLDSVNNDFWFPAGQIAFSSPIERDFPVVADPSPPGPDYCGAAGDLDVDSGYAFGDAPFAETNCAAAWQQRYPGRRGIPIIFARSFCINSMGIRSSTRGVAAPPNLGLWVESASPLTGRRGDDLCGSPQRLSSADITNQGRRPFVVMVEPASNTIAPKTLAHELGHNLFLGHGNGLDDNHDGRPVGRRGPRRYDEYCDPGGTIELEVPVEDGPYHAEDCERTGSLMVKGALCSNLRPLQVETARGVARLIPGFVDTTPRPKAKK